MSMDSEFTEEAIAFQSDLNGIDEKKLQGFFVDWPDPPSAQGHLEILKASHGIELACDTTTGMVVGFINVISDGCFCSYIPLLEVLPNYQGSGIARELIRRIVARYGDLYMLDLCCNEEIAPVYDSHGFQKVCGMARRNYARQSGT